MKAYKDKIVSKAGNRFEVIQKQKQGLMTVKEASALLKMTPRHFLRIKKTSEKGLKFLLDERRGSHQKRVSEEEKMKILKLKRDTYVRFNTKHFQYVLSQKYGIKRSYEYLRKILKENCLASPKHRRRKKKRQRKRFEAKAGGFLVQRDTSIHMWLPYHKKPLKLIVDIDDHSRKITAALFSYHDDVLSNMAVTQQTIVTHGVPIAYYMDNNPIYNPIKRLPKQLDFYRYRNSDNGEEKIITQFKRSLHDLGIECIHSTPYEPQGKGKVERLFRFMQDRLLEEMLIENVSTLQEANEFLRKWVDWYNHSHVHRTTGMIPNQRLIENNKFKEYEGTNEDLSKIFCLKDTRVVSNDHTISFEGKIYQLKPKNRQLILARKKVELRISLNYRLKIYYENTCVHDCEYKPKNNKTLDRLRDILV